MTDLELLVVSDERVENLLQLLLIFTLITAVCNTREIYRLNTGNTREMYRLNTGCCL